MKRRRLMYTAVTLFIAGSFVIPMCFGRPTQFSVTGSPQILPSAPSGPPSLQQKAPPTSLKPNQNESDSAAIFLSQVEDMEQPFGVNIASTKMEFVETHTYWFPAASDDTSYQSNVSTKAITPALIDQIHSGWDVENALLQGTGRVMEVHPVSIGPKEYEVRIGLHNGIDISLFCRDLVNIPLESSLVNFVGLPLGTVTLIDTGTKSNKSSTLIMDAVALTKIQ